MKKSMRSTVSELELLERISAYKKYENNGHISTTINLLCKEVCEDRKSNKFLWKDVVKCYDSYEDYKGNTSKQITFDVDKSDWDYLNEDICNNMQMKKIETRQVVYLCAKAICRKYNIDKINYGEDDIKLLYKVFKKTMQLIEKGDTTAVFSYLRD